jgi:hypothetical protein
MAAENHNELQLRFSVCGSGGSTLCRNGYTATEEKKQAERKKAQHGADSHRGPRIWLRER